jgi:hypothetical protein
MSGAEFNLPDDCDSRIRALHDYWRSIHPAEGLPGRAHFDPLDVPKLLPHLWLVDVEQDPFQFRFRLIGTAVAEAIGEDLTGRYLGEAFENFRGSDALHALLEVVSGGRPSWRRGPPTLTRKDYDVRLFERIQLPLATDGSSVDMLVALSAYVLPDDLRD